MPSHSEKQAKVMSAISHGWRPSGLDIPVGVAKEFHAADKGSKYGAKGRAFGGVAPMLAQASNPVMGAMPQMGMTTPPQLGMNAMPQTGTNGVADGLMGPPPSGLGGSMNQSPTVSRPLKTGGVASGHSKPVKMTTGPLVSTVPGRTDLHFTHVPSGSYVIPADIVSAHGQGNTLAGMKHLHQFFRMDDHTTSHNLAKTKSTDRHLGKPVPVKLAGGEIVLPPDKVHSTMERVFKKKLTLDEAHRKMDSWVILQRKKLRKTLANLKPPVKD